MQQPLADRELRRRRTLIGALVCLFLILPEASFQGFKHDVADFVRGFADGAAGR